MKFLLTYLPLKTFLCCFLFSSGDAFAGNEPSICNSCVQESDFKIVAESAGEGEQLVINPNTMVIKKYLVIIDQSLGIKTSISQDLNSSEISQRSKFLNWQTQMHTIETNLGVSDVVGAGNGCGGAGQDWIPDSVRYGIFYFACNNHDICYENGVNRPLCDEMLEIDMERIAWEEYDRLRGEDKLISAYFTRAYLASIAKLSRKAVEKFGAEFYCADGANSENAICIIYNNDYDSLSDAVQGGFAQILQDMGDLNYSYESGTVTIYQTCTTYIVSFGIDGEFGNKRVYEQCVVTTN